MERVIEKTLQSLKQIEMVAKGYHMSSQPPSNRQDHLSMAERIENPHQLHGLFLRQSLYSILQHLFQLYQKETLAIYSKKQLGSFELQCQMENILLVLKCPSPIEKNAFSLAQLNHNAIRVKAMKIAFLQAILECGITGNERGMAQSILTWKRSLLHQWHQFKSSLESCSRTDIPLSPHIGKHYVSFHHLLTQLKWELKLLVQQPDNQTLIQRFRQDCLRLYQQVDEWIEDSAEPTVEPDSFFIQETREEPIEYEAVVKAKVTCQSPVPSKPLKPSSLAPQDIFKIQVIALN
jgi:hypothetical protein